MLWRPPIWAGSVASLWRLHAFFALLAAVVEATIGFWLREIPSLSIATATTLQGWLAGLACLLAARVLFAWRRDLAREAASFRSGVEFHHALWAGSQEPPCRPDNSWLAREGREWIESGTRAAAEMRTAVATLAVLLPALLWLAPWLALAVAVAALALGWVAQKRSEAGKALAEADGSDSRSSSEAEEWAWRSMPEATGSGIGQEVSGRFKARGEAYARRRLERARSILAWGALGESTAHAGGWVLAVVSLAAWKMGWLPAGNLAGFLGIALLAYRPVREAGRLLPQLQKAEGIWERLRERTTEREGSATPSRDLRVEDLRAGWNLDVPVLTGLSFRMEPGDIVVAEGGNGCGKSTLLASIAGNCPHSAVHLSVPSTRKWMAQEPILPPIEPRQWIPNPNPSALEILFPDGLPKNLDWESAIPRGGQDLSRGERARIVLLSIASGTGGLWLLDEPLSALPSNQRSRILTGLLALREDAMVLLAEPVLPAGLVVDSVLWTSPQGAGTLTISKARPC